VAARVGHSVAVLLRVYAKCLDGQEDVANRLIEATLDSYPARGHAVTQEVMMVLTERGADAPGGLAPRPGR
jgi:hypothetical protein